MTNPACQLVPGANPAISLPRNIAKTMPSEPDQELARTILITLPGLLLASAVAISAYRSGNYRGWRRSAL